MNLIRIIRDANRKSGLYSERFVLQAKRDRHLNLLIFVLCFCLFTLSTASAQSPPANQIDSAQVQLRDQKWEAAKKAQQEGDYVAAIKAGEAVIAIERQLLGDNHPELIGTIAFLADCEEAREMWDAAWTRREDVLARTINAYGDADYRVIDARQASKHLSILKNLTREQLQSLTEAKRANGMIVKLYREGKFDAGIKLAKTNLKLREAILGHEHTDTATSLNNLAGLHQQLANYAAAEPLYKRALKIMEKALGPDHPVTAQSLNYLGRLYISQGNYAAAEPLYRRALKIRERALESNHPDTAESLNNLAVLYMHQSNHTAAEPLLHQALKVREDALGPNHPDTAQGLNNLAHFYGSQGNYAAAEPLYQRALKIRENALGPEHPDTALSLNNLAELYREQSNYAAAEPLYQLALKIREKALGSDHPNTALSLNNLAVLYFYQSNYAVAEPLYQRALKIREIALGPDHPHTAISLNNLAELYQSQSNYAAAEPLFQRALKICEKNLGPDHPDTGICLNNLANVYHSQLNYAAAEPLYLRTLKIMEKALGPDHPQTATSLSNLAELCREQSNYAAAEPLHQRALKIEEKAFGSEHPRTARSLNNLAALFWDEHRDEESRQLVSRSTARTIAQLERTAVIQSEAQQFLMTTKNRGNIDFYLTLQETDAGAARETWGTLLNWKGLITTRQTRLRQVLKNEPEYAALQSITQQLSTHVLNPPRPPDDPKLIAAWNENAPALRQAWQYQRTNLESDYERIEKELSQKSALFRATLQQQQATFSDIQQLLDARALPTALVDLVEYQYRTRGKEPDERRIAAFVIRGDGTVTRMELGSAKEIAELIQVWRSTFGRDDKGQEAAGRLRERLWQPLTTALAGAKVVVISPDGVLGEFPWNALPGSTPGSFLLEEVSLAVIPVPQILPQLLQADPTNEPPTSLLLVGEISYGGDAGKPGDAVSMRAMRNVREGKSMQFPPLPAAQAEISSIRARYEDAIPNGDAKRLRKSEATEAAFRTQAARHPWLHVITHGYFAPDNVLEPSPQFAGIGAALEVIEDKLRIKRIVADGAAAKDGRLQAGDEIVAVSNPDNDWIVMYGKTLEDVVSLIRGPVGTEISLQVLPIDKDSEPVKYTLKRAAVSLPPAKEEAVHPGLLSGLAFAGANTPPEEGKDDGILTALEVSALDLSQVDTVVLSACETGLGQVAGGEGLLGLQRAFQVAGAKTTVASLWKVPDQATATLMQRFYENLWDKKMGKLEALRQAQIWMLRDNGNRGLAIPDHPADAQTLPPYYWAAFVLSGDWR